MDAIKETFLAEGYSEEKVNTYIENCGKVRFCKTNSRSVLSRMTQVDLFVDSFIDEYAFTESINLVGLNMRLGQLIVGGATPEKLLKLEMEKIEV